MNFEHSEEQQQLADSLRRFLANEYSFEQRKAIVGSEGGLSAAAWQGFADMGITAITMPEAEGGFGGGAVDLLAAMEAMGAALVVEPFVDCVGLAARLVARAGTDAQRAAILPGVVDGSLLLTCAYLERGRRYELGAATTTARRLGEGWVLEGEKVVVVGAPAAAKWVVSARTADGTSLFVVDRHADGVSVSPYRTVDGQRAADVRLAGVRLAADALLGPVGGGLELLEEAVDFATALQCAEAIGVMADANDATLEYLKTRKQFGVSIGSFQALQHRMVDMYIACEQARSMAILAAARVDANLPAAERQRAVSQAKIKIADAARLVSQESVQLHGGMGMTEELKVSHSFRRLTTIAQRFGDADHHLARCAALG